MRLNHALCAAIVTAGVGLLVVSGCRGDKPNPVVGNPVEAGTAGKVAPVSLANDVVPLFARSCGVCHKRSAGNSPAVRNKKYYENGNDILSNVGKHVIAGQPDESGLVEVCDQSRPVGGRKMLMPPPGSGVEKFSADDIEVFRKWIAEGAKDN